MTSTIVILPGAGSAGLAWREVANQLNARVVPIPDRPSVEQMADDVIASLENVRDTLLLVGASLGAMVALEVARKRAVAGMVLLAAGVGVTVSEQMLRRVETASPDDLLDTISRAGLAHPTDELVTQRRNDFEARGVTTLAHHLRALSKFVPEPLEDPPPVIVLWGQADRSVPFEDHLELAIACQGALRPLPDVAHAAYLEAPQEVVRWTRFLQASVEGERS
jgi:pimeloyl-ACP methyl ester carboxylesterase